MDFIKNKEQFLENANGLINGYGEPKELAETIDEMIFRYMDSLTHTGEGLASFDMDNLYKARKIRDLFNSIQTK